MTPTVFRLPTIMRPLFFLSLALTLAGCVSSTAQRSDGLIDFLLGNPGEVDVPIEMIGNGGGRIETASVRVFGRKVFVSGFVSRAGPGHPQPGAHVDVLVVDAHNRLIETQLADYLPRSIPPGLRGGFAHSRFTTRLKALPPPDATVKVMFHDQPKRTCDFNPAWHPGASAPIPKRR